MTIMYANKSKLLKLFKKNLQINKSFIPLQSQLKRESQIEIWCNGSTTDSGSVSEGSSPSISTKRKSHDGGIAQLVRAHDS